MRRVAVALACAGLLLVSTGCEPEEQGTPTTPRANPTLGPVSEAEEPDEHQALAERYAPMVWLARDDEHGPADASQFVRDSELWFDHGRICKDDEPVAVDVDERKLGRGEYRHHAAAQPHPQSEDPLSCNHDETKEFTSDQWLDEAPDTGGGGKGFYLDIDDDHRDGDGTGSPVYWQHEPTGDGTSVIVYWLFYAYNDSTNNHEGDWERIAIQFAGDRPTGVTFWKHEHPACVVPWEDMEKSGERPVTYSAKGAHGSYPAAGNHPHTGGVDVTSKGNQWKTWRQVRHANSQAWYGYAGLWGVTGPKWFSGIPGPHERRNLADAGTDLPCEAPPAQSYFGDWVSPEPVNQPESPTVYRMKVSLRDGEVGDIVGRAEYPELTCAGDWILEGKLPDKLVLRERITDDPRASCEATGRVEVSLTPEGLHWEYFRDGQQHAVAWAELVRQ